MKTHPLARYSTSLLTSAFLLCFNVSFCTEKDNTSFPIGQLPNLIKKEIREYLDEENLKNFFLIGKGTYKYKDWVHSKNDLKLKIKKMTMSGPSALLL